MSDEKQSMHQALVERIRTGAGSAPAELRDRAFRNSDVPPALHSLIDKVVTRPAEITDADFATAGAAGFDDDQLFELVVAAAVGRSTGMYRAGLAALAEAKADR
ncbi:hypothetical protein NONO_c62540 [Nocardia nova SH22a]|uniref:Uncharacterized protein n=1 Tax=Nocardia nova SH22a TaxID=1415166 RepID=W5TPF7_9NOCA|nr:hypothetical protein [Nocardia nova]AHH21024.1 hypothetical protein NONO_c62540 [Nocardia nova SH22a]